jgi:heat shock protein HslJ
MNMLFIKKNSWFMLACLCIVACNQSGDKEQQNTTSTNTAETPLIIPDNPTQTSTNLQDIWVLDSINNKAPDSNYFAHGTPVFDLNLEKKTVSGHTGCNGLNGKLKVDGQKLLFDSLVVSKEICKDKGFEKKLLKAFNSDVTYKILNDKLYMDIEPGTIYIFRRIRR